MVTRREFLEMSSAGLAVMGHWPLTAIAAPGGDRRREEIAVDRPVVVSTWRHGLAANEAAWAVLAAGGPPLDAAETGVRVTEADPEVTTVGLGGDPDRDGRVTLDACIMTGEGDAGSVACLEGILHPVSVARAVMERTAHVMLVGAGAREFALSEGFDEAELLTPRSRAAWEAWRADQEIRSEKSSALPIDEDHHDTIGLLALDVRGRIAGACTTSGAAYKLPGRVGDSPVLGAGLFVDGAVGGACATGRGELVLRTLGSFLVVELMRNGASPGEACREAVGRISRLPGTPEGEQVGFVALGVSGESGAWALRDGFQWARRDGGGAELYDAPTGE